MDPRNLFAVALALGALFCYLALLAGAHLRDRALVGLCRQVAALRRKQEDLRNQTGAAPLLARYERFEKAARTLLTRPGLRA